MATHWQLFSVSSPHLEDFLIPMEKYESLVFVLTLSLLIGSVRTYVNNRRHWYGVILLPIVLMWHIPNLLMISIIYIKIMNITASNALKPYIVLISFLAALIAELLPHLVLHSRLPDWAVSRQIAMQKKKTVDELETNPLSRKIVQDAILTADELNRQRKTRLLRNISPPPTRGEIFQIIDEVGLSHMMKMLPRT